MVMGLRCLIGHDFDPPQTTREREDRGGEVVITVREYKECSRCGHRRIVSENTEVKANPDAAVEEEPTTEEPSPTAGDESFEDVTAEEDDGIILEDDPEAVEERQRGQWPEVDEEDLDEVQHDPWPEAEGEDEGFAAEPSEGDGPAEDVTFRGGGLTPEKATTEYPPGPAEEADEEETVGSDTPAGIRSAGPSSSQSGGQQFAGVETMFVCPECGHTEPTASSSLRPGDICPECRRGYLSEQPRE